MSYLSEEEVSESLLALEQQHDLYSMQINGCSIWRFLKFPISADMAGLPFGRKANSNRILQVASQFFASMRELPMHFFLPKADYFVSTCGSFYQVLPDGGHYDSFFDDYLEGLGTIIKLEHPNTVGFVSRHPLARHSFHMTTRFLNLLTALAARAVTNLYQMHPTIEKLSGILRNLKGGDKYTPLLIAKIVRHAFIQRKLYRFLLRQAEPKAVLLSDTGDFGLSMAASDLKIPVLEFQHGVFTKFHPDALNYTARNYRSNVLARDRIFLYGEYWKKQLETSGFYQDELRVVGSSRIDKYRKARQSRIIDNSRTKLLITMQNLDVENVLHLVRSLLDKWTQSPPLEVVFKLHPLQETTKTLYEEYFRGYKGVKILLGTDEPSTYEIMASCDFHMSIASACHYDAIGIGLPTLILPFSGHELVMHLHFQGHGHLIQSVPDMIDILENPIYRSLPSGISEFYYRPNAVDNVQKEIMEII